jgi:hypothetical protein
MCLWPPIISEILGEGNSTYWAKSVFEPWSISQTCCQINIADTVSVKSGNLGCYFGPLFHCLASCGQPCQPCQPRRLRVSFTLDFRVPNPENFFSNNALAVKPPPPDHPPRRWTATSLLLLPALLSHKEAGTTQTSFPQVCCLCSLVLSFVPPISRSRGTSYYDGTHP